MTVVALHPITGQPWEYPPQQWLCGHDKCKGELEREPDRHAYRCLRCGEVWSALRDYDLNTGPLS